LLSGLSAEWRAAHARAFDRPPLRPRLPLAWQGHAIGSVEPELVAHAELQRQLANGPLLLASSRTGVELLGDDLTAALARLAFALRDAGLAGRWRDEQLAVCDAQGRPLGTIERGAVRPLGIATTAVHLAAWAPDGRWWLQQRAFDKATDPGLWDTLVGGMVPAGETPESALPRETWEEAGLRMGQFVQVAHGGRLLTRRPATEVAHGYVVEHLHWVRAVLPEGVVPSNQDGEVAAFACLDAAAVRGRLEQGEFALDASAILLAADAS
jgi:8-oxo-dGTP pyrophosphatase MutT (NUDIX family)